ncbi:MAG TPA: glycosyltransferase [Kofleriaceae bacterium]|nr:glycosyltransferase [Kofleriaceae bacterium]
MVLAAAWVVYLAALALLGVYGVHRLTLVARAHRRRPPAAPALPPPAALPVVTVQLPIYNEQAVAARVIAAAAALDWPRDRLEVQVLDDSTDATREVCAAAVAAARAAGVDAVHVHRRDRAGWKAGALEAGRAVARGELLCVLDADFVPPPDFLRRTAGHFADPAVGMVQARWDHLNRERSLLTRLQALLLDGHFAVEQAGRAQAGACFNFNGTAGLWRAAAIADAGGWQADTLTEDLDLSYRAALRGWRFVYVDDVAAPAELPADVLAFKSQQFRWAKGSIECARKLVAPAVRAPWPLRHRLEAVFHLTHNLPYLLTLLVLIAGGVALAGGGGPAWAGWIHAGSAVVTVAVLAAFVGTAQRRLGRGLITTAARVPALIALTAGLAVSQSRALVEGLIGQRSEFVRTPKDGAIGAGRGQRRYRVGPGATIVAEAALAVHLIVCTTIAGVRGVAVEAAVLAWFAAGVAWIVVASVLAGRRSPNAT